jgi:hypothetical protein
MRLLILGPDAKDWVEVQKAKKGWLHIDENSPTDTE